ncbi:xylulose kinase XylB [Clostridium aceticum]|uniref:Xylulose kinase XylB n=1 Tax=Clostridium aceticum TaxID=84022 RepID=A0A0D8I772_9CLOT|nr:FGGY-family carbohydrate kinase [Clostridium aceticum]AKL93841.1 xylulose kinase XylB [Clostridium aceticum]KJF25867.1 actin [Clostridium aceticum]
MAYLIGVDIGTQGTKAVLINPSGKVLAHSYRGYDVETPKPSWAQQWPEPWEEATCATIKEVVEKSKVGAENIKGVAISSLYGGSGIPVDQDMKPLAPCLIWMDRRAEAEVKWVEENIDLDELFQVTGNSVNSYFGFTKILWMKNNLDIWDKIQYFLPPAPYLVYKLTGEVAVDYSSAGNIGGVFNLKERTWSKDMIEKLGIPLEFFPQRLVECTEIVGGITKEAAIKTGLKVDTPVICGGVDAPVATLGAGAFSEGNHVAMTGTSMCWGFITNKPNLSPKLVSMPHTIDSKEIIYTFGGAATAGAVVRWFRDIFGAQEMAAEESLGINAYTLLELKAKDVPAGSEGLLVLPYFMGERSPIWDSNARGTILGLSLFHNKAHLYKAFMEGVAYSLRHNMEMVAETDAVLDRETILVGGGSKSTIWPQIYADVTGRPVRIIKNDVEAPLGDALLAGLATGVIKDPGVITTWLDFEDTIEPNLENTKKYDKYYEQYKQVYLNLKENMMALNQIGKE